MLRRMKGNKGRPSSVKAKLCEAGGCTKPLTGRQRKYCSDRCKARQHHRNKHGKVDVQTKYGALQADDQFLRRGPVYEMLLDHPITEQILDGTVTIGYAADQLGVNRTAVTRSIASIVVDRRQANETALLSYEGQRNLLGPSEEEIPDPSSDEFDQYLDDLVDSWVRFRTRFFEARRGEAFVNKRYHLKWIRATLHAILTGGQQIILSPPRHGKSELMVHFCVWLIVRNPDIRIMWVAASDPLARQMVGAVKDHLQHNVALCEDFLGPGKNFKLEGKWAALEFTTSERTVIGQKSYTMVGLGWRGTILSRDCDFIVMDDIEDDRSIGTPGNRETTRHKFATSLDSRNEDHTAVLVIGSRQHPDDLYGHLIDNSEWRSIVEQAHDDACEINPADLPAHTVCMLWHERHPYSWWYSKWSSMKQLGLEYIFEMVYQNRPRPLGMIVFHKEHIIRARNYDRKLGDLSYFEGKPLHLMIAGFDPSAVGKQAYWIWLFDPTIPKAYNLDAFIDHGGGLDKFKARMIDWHTKYQLSHWKTEKNNIQEVFTMDSKIREVQGSLGIDLVPHQTGTNKHDLEFGLPGLARWIEEEMIDLAYGDEHSVEMADLFQRQAVGYEIDTAGKPGHKGKYDLLMSAWFPFNDQLDWAYEGQSEVETMDEVAFAGYSMTSYGDGVPW